MSDYFKMYETKNNYYISDGNATMTSIKSTPISGNGTMYRQTSSPKQQQMWCSDGANEIHNDPFLSRDNLRNQVAQKQAQKSLNFTRNLCSTVSYLVIVATLAVLSSVAVYMLWNDYVFVGKFIIETNSFSSLDDLEFPTVTICNKQPFNVDRVAFAPPYSGGARDSLIAAIRNVTDFSNFSALDEVAVNNEGFFYASYSRQFAYEHRNKLDQFVSLCKFYNSRYDCDLIFKPVYVPLKGMCYRSQVNKAWPIAPGPFLGLDVYFYFDRYRDSAIFGRGAVAIIGDHQGTENAIPINAGVSTSLSLREVRYFQENSFSSHQCYHSNHTPFSYAQASTSASDEAKLGYSIETCRNLCTNKLWYSAFGCYFHAGFYPDREEECMDDTEQRKLTTRAQVTGDEKLTKQLRQEYSACCKQCYPLCDYKTYKYTVMNSPMKTGADYMNKLMRNEFTTGAKKWIQANPDSGNPNSMMKSWSHLKVFIDSSSRKETITYQPVSSATRFFADICAIFGLVFAIFYTLLMLKSIFVPPKEEGLTV